MDTQSLVTRTDLTQPIADLRARMQDSQHAISDVIDADGNQYIDLVMEGGGMLGIALVGYTWALEEMGIRFRGIGGTSAGSINALLLAAIDTPDMPKSPKLLREMAALNFYSFVDGGSDVRELIELALGEDKPFRKLRIFWKALSAKKTLCLRYGLNKGDAFLGWLTGLLKDAGIQRLDELNDRMGTMPDGLRVRDGASFSPSDWPRGELVIVAADVTTETRVEFPRMASLYWPDPDTISPALFARASMAIPFFFEPLRITGISNTEQARTNWSRLAGYHVNRDPTAKVPANALFVDGGVMSNFPIDAFHDTSKIPRMPTFGIKLEYDQRYKSEQKLPLQGQGRLKDLGPLAGAIFNSARHTLDYEFIKKHPDYRHLVQFIPCLYEDPASGEMKSYNWLDFSMSEEHREGLFIQGAQKAIDFIDRFSGPVDSKGMSTTADRQAFASRWQYYKSLRKKIAE